MEKIVTDFGYFIKEKRIEKGLTQSDMAKILNISQVAYGRYELGTRDPGLNMILKIADALDFAPGEFFDSYICFCGVRKGGGNVSIDAVNYGITHFSGNFEKSFAGITSALVEAEEVNLKGNIKLLCTFADSCHLVFIDVFAFHIANHVRVSKIGEISAFQGSDYRICKAVENLCGATSAHVYSVKLVV